MVPQEKNTKKTTVTRTIRIPDNFDEVLKQDAERKGISVNTLVEQILKKYVHADRYYSNLQAISMSDSSFGEIISRLDDEAIVEAAYVCGSNRPKNRLLMRGLPLDYENIIWYLTVVMGDLSGWYRADYHSHRDHDILHLRHHHGEKWSKFLSVYFETMFNELLSLKPQLEVLGNALTVTIDKDKL